MAAYGGYDYEFIDPLPDECPCAVCHLVQKEPHQVTCCGKIYCKSCLDELMRKGNNCPNCRGYISRKRRFTDLNTDRKIKHLKICCSNKENGCNWTGHLKDLDNHRSKCPNEMVTCENRDKDFYVCRKSIQRCQLKKHMEEECNYRMVTCEDCGLEDIYIFIAYRHIEICPEKKVPCNNKGCGASIKRKLLKDHSKTCPKSIVPCQYSSVGCKAEITRDSVKKHNQDHMEEHLSKAVTTLENVVEQLHDVTKRLDKYEQEKYGDYQEDYESREQEDGSNCENKDYWM